MREGKIKPSRLMTYKGRPPLIGTWIDVLLFAYEVTEIAKYFNRYPKDSLVLKVSVTVLLFVDFAAIIAMCAYTYLCGVTYWGKLDSLLKNYWPTAVHVILCCINTLLVQTFLIHRCWVLTKRWYIVIVALLCSLAAARDSSESVLAVTLKSMRTSRRSFQR
ncbi:hypothetical protein K435DRAFT_840840 [Dendrothele bispora CBS 962.96]|uniref:Uncharacterized protein n=1 Tax=Dendrothele bispora (strain CBS 962.96) TaxID=1314807 RepID=A0A4S8LQU5_DENBC|nr:hypothetical protein K435DRAFT_840840 [Dendrothele bispora CBS 962.96]